MRSKSLLATLSTTALSLFVLSGCGSTLPLSQDSAESAPAAIAVTQSSNLTHSRSEASTTGAIQVPSSPDVNLISNPTLSGTHSRSSSSPTSTSGIASANSSSSTNSGGSIPGSDNSAVLNTGNTGNTGNGNTQHTVNAGNTTPNRGQHKGTQKSASSPVIKYPQHATKQISPEVWTVPSGDVAITIDDGPSPYTLSIISVLQKYHVHATFFFVGSRVKYWPDAVKAAVTAGDEIGDHTETHPLLTNLSSAAQAQQIVGAAKEIQQYDPLPITLFRPPYEGFNNATERILVQNHMALALWNRDPRDWAAKTSQQIVNAVVHSNPSGGVFDMHDKLLTLEALPTIIQDLQKLGLHFVLLQAPAGSTGIAANAGPTHK